MVSAARATPLERDDVPSSNQGSASSKDTSATATATATAAADDTAAAAAPGGGGHPYGVKPWGNFLTDGGGPEVCGRGADRSIGVD